MSVTMTEDPKVSKYIIEGRRRRKWELISIMEFFPNNGWLFDHKGYTEYRVTETTTTVTRIK